MDVVTSQNVMSVNVEEKPSKALEKDDAWVSSWKQEERKWMKDDMVTYSKCLRQRMTVEPSLIPTVYTIIVCIDYIFAIVYTFLPDELQCTYALIWCGYFRNQECLQEWRSNIDSLNYNSFSCKSN